GRFENDSILLEEGAKFTIVADEDIVGNAERAGTTYLSLPNDVRPGDQILLDDGLRRLRVDDVVGSEVRTTVMVGGKLSNNKGMNLPGVSLSTPSLTDKDREDLAFGLDLGVDLVALSFVRSALDILELRAILAEHPRRDTPGIISKIEKPEALDELDDIIAASD